MTSQAVFDIMLRNEQIMHEDVAAAINHLAQPTIDVQAYIQQVEHMLMQNTNVLRARFHSLQNKNEFPSAKQSRILVIKYTELENLLKNLEAKVYAKGASTAPVVQLIRVISDGMIFAEKMQKYETAAEVQENGAERLDVKIAEQALKFFNENEFKMWKNSLASVTALRARFNNLIPANLKYAGLNGVQVDMAQLHNFETQLSTALGTIENALTAAVKEVNAAHKEEEDLERKYPGQRQRITREAAQFWMKAEAEAKTVEVELVSLKQLENSISMQLSRLKSAINDPTLAQQMDPVIMQLNNIDIKMENNVYTLINLMNRLINHIRARYA